MAKDEKKERRSSAIYDHPASKKHRSGDEKKEGKEGSAKE